MRVAVRVTVGVEVDVRVAVAVCVAVGVGLMMENRAASLTIRVSKLETSADMRAS